MKVRVEIDCTPLEARQSIGLPDVAPMQIAVMDELQQQMMANIDKASPEALMQSWFTFDPKLAARFQDFSPPPSWQASAVRAPAATRNRDAG